jgi:hypothetical protein
LLKRIFWNIDKMKTASIAKDIERYFDFLNRRGFRIRSVEYAPQFNGSWVVELESPTCIIFITSDRSHLLLEFSVLNDSNVNNRITLEKIIYEISRGKVIVEPFKGNLAWGKKKQLERLSGLLAKHVDEIMLWFNNKSGKFLTST